MTAPDPDALSDWILETVTATTAEALLQARVSLAPRHILSDSLVVDVEPGSLARLWITETTLGGVGVLQFILAAVFDALTTPIDVGYLQFFPKVERTERQADGLIIALVVQEQV